MLNNLGFNLCSLALLAITVAVIYIIGEVLLTVYKRWKYKGMRSIEVIDGVIHVDNIKLKNVTTYLDPDERVVFVNIAHGMDLKFINRGK